MGKDKLNNSLKLIAKTSVLVFIGVLISKIALYIYRIIIARYYGPEAYGLFSLALMILNLFVAVSGLGLSEGLLRYLPIFRGKKQNNNINHVIRISEYISFISSLIFAFLLYNLSNFISITIFHNASLTIYLKISSLIIPFYVLSGIYLSILRGFEMVGIYSFIINILQNIIKLLALGLIIYLGLNSSWIMFSFFLGILIMSLFSYYICKKKIPNIFINGKGKGIKKGLFKSILFYSTPLMFSSVFSIVYYWIDSFAIGYLKDVTEVGFYNAVIPIAILIYFVPDLFIQLFYPLITKEYSKKNLLLVQEISKQIGKWILVLTLPLFLMLFIFPGVIINFLFGPNYLVAEQALRILSVGGFFAVLTGLLTTLLATVGKSKTIFANLILTSGLNIVLNFILIPKYGINGAAIATSIVWIILTITLFIEVKMNLFFVPLRKKMVKVFLVSFLALLFLLFIRTLIKINIINVILVGILFLFLYFLLIFLTGCLDRNDKIIINSLRYKIRELSDTFLNRF